MEESKPLLPPKTIAVDFDGTICDHAFPHIGKIKSGVKEALTIFKELGYLICIWSCRTCHYHYDIFGGNETIPTLERERVVEMIQFLKDNEIPYDFIDDGSKGKPSADFYIDDKAIRYQNNWDAIAKYVKAKDEIVELHKEIHGLK